MLCDACFRMLRGQEGRIWKGTYDLHFNRHTNGQELKKSANMNCGICRVLYEELHSNNDTIDEMELLVSASLSVLFHPRVQHLYRLDFKLRYGSVRSQRTFILKKTNSGDPLFRTPISHNTSSDEVYQLSREWMSRCKCADTHRPLSWYPARLVRLEELKTQGFLDTRKLVSTIQRDPDTMDQTRVKVVETEVWKDGRPGHGNIRYVTLSHRWGSDAHKQLKLTSENINEFRMGIRLSTLPKTFREAIEFAARLPRVGYIWIDSLCIKQGPGEGEDWLKQSASMDRVYSETFLNISATAATNSDCGLFFPRRPELLLEDKIILNIEGIPGVTSRKSIAEVEPEPAPIPPRRVTMECLEAYWLTSYILLLLRQIHTLIGISLGATLQVNQETRMRPHPRASLSGGDVMSIRDSNPARDGSVDEPSSEADHKNLCRCTILDVSFWTNNIEKAPVHTRGWVLQERILAPRALHFCRNQVALECACFDAAKVSLRGCRIFNLY
ncbi:HET-domain-containing protein [Lentithecium fluviatile CBS 122367]|uniref:HET-domain-containing protein n=1 Tax=Lentithecium fluviatile CBS 122367 TaxID=1168545 RepID=A0A6G1JNK4_9PLEO|nr:HET-domain-containing protein [Lentithecium fluviatile CBS 122367]